jgi:hypothetical protein
VARTPAAGDGSLKRLGGGRWQTRDERFSIEPQSGTWVVVDAEQTDDLGLPLVRGPFRSLTDAKEAIAEARSSPAAASPLADRIGRRRATPEALRPDRTAHARAEAGASPAPKKRPEPPDELPAEPRDRPRDEPAPEPRWVTALDPGARRQARRLIARLEAADAPDPEGMARRDIVGDVAAVAAFAVKRQLDGLGPKPEPEDVAALLAAGRDEDLGVRWRLVDEDGRPIAIDSRKGGTERRQGRR